MLNTGLTWLERKRRSFMSEAATYSGYRDDLGTIEFDVRVTWGQTEYEMGEETGMRIGATILDVIITEEDLNGIEPTLGDVIQTSTRKVEVVDLGDGVWSWTGPFHKSRRIHVEEKE